MHFTTLVWALCLTVITVVSAADQTTGAAGLINQAPTPTTSKFYLTQAKTTSLTFQAPTAGTTLSEHEIAKTVITPAPVAELDARGGHDMIIPVQDEPWSSWCIPPDEYCTKKGDKHTCVDGSVWKRTARPIAFATLQPRDDRALCLQSMMKNCQCVQTKTKGVHYDPYGKSDREE